MPNRNHFLYLVEVEGGLFVVCVASEEKENVHVENACVREGTFGRKAAGKQCILIKILKLKETISGHNTYNMP